MADSLAYSGRADSFAASEPIATAMRNASCISGRACSSSPSRTWAVPIPHRPPTVRKSLPPSPARASLRAAIPDLTRQGQALLQVGPGLVQFAQRVGQVAQLAGDEDQRRTIFQLA